MRTSRKCGLQGAKIRKEVFDCLESCLANLSVILPDNFYIDTAWDKLEASSASQPSRGHVCDLMQGVAGKENALPVFLASALGLPWQGTPVGFDATLSNVPPATDTGDDEIIDFPLGTKATSILRRLTSK